MARFREYWYAQTVMLPVVLGRQLQSGSFEYAINHLVDHCIDRSLFEERCANDDMGDPAIDPAILLKIVLFAYSPGHSLEPYDCPCVRRKRHLYGAVGGHPPPLHHDRELHLLHGRRHCQSLSRRTDDLHHRRAYRSADVRHRRVQDLVELCEGVDPVRTGPKGGTHR